MKTLNFGTTAKESLEEKTLAWVGWLHFTKIPFFAPWLRFEPTKLCYCGCADWRKTETELVWPPKINKSTKNSTKAGLSSFLWPDWIRTYLAQFLRWSQ
jgi:hypothetical protein